MTTIRQIFEAQEKGKFDYADWLAKLTDAKSARMAWDTDYEMASAVLSNEVVDTDSQRGVENFTDKTFHTNWLLKTCIWLESYIASADVYLDVKSNTGADDYYPDRLVLEMELNRLTHRFEMPRKWATGVIPKRIRYGFGASYTGWDGMARDAYWRNGKPNFMALDPRRVWVDPGSNADNFADRQYVFCKVEVPVADAKEMFPAFADKIAETPANEKEGDGNLRKNKFDYYICQYKRLVRMRMVDADVTMNGKVERQQFAFKQLQEFVRDNPQAQLPDNIQIADDADENGIGYDANVTAVYQFIFSPDISEPLSEIEYIGDIDQFQFWGYHRIDGDIYPRGVAYMLQNEQRLKTMLLTKAAIDVINNGRAIPIPRPGALKNFPDFVEKHNQLDYVPELDREWAESHPGVDPIIWQEPKIRADITMFFNQLLQGEMQQFTGATDSMLGQPQYANMSAAQTGMLQASGATYTKTDELSYRDYVKDVSECLARLIATYMTYEHTIDGINDAGQSATITVNRGGVSDWNWERYYSEPLIENSPEMIKQLKEQRAMQLNGMGAMSPVRMLYELGYNNAEQIIAEASQWNAVMGMAQRLLADPVYAEQVQKLDAQMQSKEQAAEKAKAQQKEPTKTASNA